MLLVQQSPFNTDDKPKVINCFQTAFKDTGVDVNSRWLVQWDGLCQGSLTTDLQNAGLKEATAWVQCEEGDLVVECKSHFTLPFVLKPKCFRQGIAIQLHPISS